MGGDAALVQPDDVRCQRQPDARIALFAGIEPVKYMGQILGIHAAPIVPDGNGDNMPIRLAGQPHRLVAVPHAVDQHVHKRPGQLILITAHPHRRIRKIRHHAALLFVLDRLCGAQTVIQQLPHIQHRNMQY